LYPPPSEALLDLNPIEQVFSKDKWLRQRAVARTREALSGALGRALSAVTARDARGLIEHCGYRLPDQSLLTSASCAQLVGMA
jgi:hypothetical protein